MLEPSSGLVIAGKYRLQRQMGAGGMGSVWLAEHMTLGSPVAVKLLHTAIADSGTLARFTAEAKAAARLRSPHVVQILDHGVDGETPFIIMERLEGESLGERLLRRPGPDFEETLTILTHTVRAVSRAHDAGIVHRDLKPDNIFLHINDDEFVAKVLDFGIAKVQPEFLNELSPQTSTGMLIGSPYYMSPEQAEGRRDLDWRSDLWALGIITYECLTGLLPYNEDTLGKMLVKLIKDEPPPPSSVAPVPEGFDDWFAKANCKDRDARFQTAKEMLHAFRALKDRPLITAVAAESLAPTLAVQTPKQYEEHRTAPGVTGPTLPPPPTPVGANHRGLLLGGAIALLGLLVLAGWFGLDERSETAEGTDINEQRKSEISAVAHGESADSLVKNESLQPPVPTLEERARDHGSETDTRPPEAKDSPPKVATPAATPSMHKVPPPATPAREPQPKQTVNPVPQPTTVEPPKPFNPLDLRY